MLRKPTDARVRFRALPWLPLAAVVALVAACASIPPPTDAMSRAQAQLKAAQQAGAADADPVDLEFARARFKQAQQAMQAGKNGKAADLAQESLADSGLALTKARLATMRSRVEAQRKENQRLRRQLLDHATGQNGKATPASSDSSVQELPQTVMPAPAQPSSTAPAPASSSASQEGQR
jgi:hypothetical protein